MDNCDRVPGIESLEYLIKAQDAKIKELQAAVVRIRAENNAMLEELRRKNDDVTST